MIYKSKLARLFESMFMAFTTEIVFVCAIGYLSQGRMNGSSSFYVTDGISFVAILQMLILAIIAGVINVIFDHESIIMKVRILYLALIKVSLIMMFTIIFILIFHWFPNNDVMAWISFFITFILCASGACVIATRRKDKEYEKLLDSYKKAKEKAS